jgi:hypothetical protein
MASTRISDIRGPKGDPSTVPGPQGLPGVNAIPAADFLGTEIARAGSPLEVGVTAKIGTIPGVVDSDTDASGAANLAAIQAALNQGGRWRLPATSGRYAITGPIEITVPGTQFISRNTPIRQVTPAQSLFNVDVPDVTIEADGIGTTTTLNVSGMTAPWELSIISSRWTAINAYSGADRLHVPWLRARGFSSAFRVTDWDRGLGARAASHVKDVHLGTILFSNCEFGLIFQGVDRFSYENVSGSYLYPTGGTRAPHAIYSSGVGADNTDVNGGVAIATYEGGAGGQAFQFKGIKRGVIGRLEADGCPGVLNVVDSQDLHIEYVNSRGDTNADVYGSVSVSQTSGTIERVSFGDIKVQMVSDGIPFRQLNGDIKVRSITAEVKHTTSGTAHDVSLAGSNCEIETVTINNVGSQSWRGFALFSGSNHRIGRVKASNVRVGVEVRTSVRDSYVGYDANDVTLHPTDGYRKLMVSTLAAPTTRLPGRPAASSRTKVLDAFSVSPDSGTAFGPALTGQSWTTQTGTWVVDQATGEAYESAGTAQSNAQVDAGLANVEVRASVKFKAFDGFSLRRVSTTEYVAVYMTTAGIVVAKRDGTLATLTSGPATTYQVGRWYSLRVQIYGARIDVFVDNVFSVSHTLAGGDETKFGSSTLHGLFSSASAGLHRFKDFEVIQL